MKTKNHQVISDSSYRAKMYKKGKTWLTAGTTITAFALGLGLTTVTSNEAQAAVTDNQATAQVDSSADSSLISASSATLTTATSTSGVENVQAVVDSTDSATSSASSADATTATSSVTATDATPAAANVNATNATSEGSSSSVTSDVAASNSDQDTLSSSADTNTAVASQSTVDQSKTLSARTASTTYDPNDPTDPRNPNARIMVINFFDVDTGEVILLQLKVSGLVGSDFDYEYPSQYLPGYELVRSDFPSKYLSDQMQDGGTFYVKHHISHSSITTTNTVNYTGAPQNPSNSITTVTWDVATDDVTGEITYTPSAGTTEVATPTIDGYTASDDSVQFDNATQTKPTDQSKTVTYTADEQSITINYIDMTDNDKVLKQVTLTGHTGEKIDFSAVIPANYVLDNTSIPSTFTAGDQQVGTVWLKHHISTKTGTVTRTIHYTGAGSSTPADVVQTIKTVILHDDVYDKDEVWFYVGDYDAVTSPSISGYTVDTSTVAAEGHSLRQPSYEALKDSKVIVNYTASNQTSTSDGSSNGSANANNSAGTDQNKSTNSSEGTAAVHGTKNVSHSLTTTVAGTNQQTAIASENTVKNKLPQTGEQKNGWLSAIGIALLSLMTMLGLRVRRRDE